MVRQLFIELIAFARAHRALVMVMLCAPTVLFYLAYTGKYFGGSAAEPVRWTSSTTRFASMRALVEHRLSQDPQLERLRSAARQRAAPPSAPVLPPPESTPTPDVLLVGGTVVRPPSAADPGLAAQVQAVLIDTEVHNTAVGPPSIAGVVSEDVSFHRTVEYLRSHLKTPPRRTVVTEYSLSAADLLPVAPGRSKDFEEFAGLANGRFFGVVLLFPLLDTPLTESRHDAVHRQLEKEIESAGLRVLDILPYIRSLDVAELRWSDSSTAPTPYATRVYAHILASYLECSRLIPSRVIVTDRSGCSRSKTKPQTKPQIKPRR